MELEPYSYYYVRVVATLTDGREVYSDSYGPTRTAQAGERDRDRETERETEKERDREREGERDRERDRGRDRQRQREKGSICSVYYYLVIARHKYSFIVQLLINDSVAWIDVNINNLINN